MMRNEIEESTKFGALLREVGHIGRQKHESALVSHAKLNLPFCEQTLRDLKARLDPKKLKSAVLVSAGPSVHKKNHIQQIKDSGFSGLIVAVDGAYVACLRKGVIPDIVVTLDPHLTRMVRRLRMGKTFSVRRLLSASGPKCGVQEELD